MPPRPAKATTRYRSARICPGVKRPPPMGSELVRRLRGGVLRGVRAGGGEDGGFGGAGASRGIVSPSKPGPSLCSVVPPSKSRTRPQEEQYLALAEAWAPHFEQNIGSANSTTAPQS